MLSVFRLRMEAGIVRSINSSREPIPMVFSIPDVSFSLGPMWRPANSFACCSNRFIDNINIEVDRLKRLAKVRRWRKKTSGCGREGENEKGGRRKMKKDRPDLDKLGLVFFLKN